MTVIRLFSFFIYIYLFCAGQYKNHFLAAYFTLLKEFKMKMNEMNENEMRDIGLTLKACPLKSSEGSFRASKA